MLLRRRRPGASPVWFVALALSNPQAKLDSPDAVCPLNRQLNKALDDLVMAYGPALPLLQVRAQKTDKIKLQDPLGCRAPRRVAPRFCARRLAPVCGPAPTRAAASQEVGKSQSSQRYGYAIL